MAYSNAIPAATDRLKDSQSAILDNFIAVKQLIDVDHATFGDAQEGKHIHVSLPVQAAAPVFAAGDEGIYNLLCATTAKNETYIHKQTQAGTVDIPLTASFLSNTVPANDMGGWTYLPSGLLLHWGNTSGAFNGLYTVTVNPAFPAFTNIFTVIAMPQNANVAATTYPVRLVNIISNTQFRLYSNGNTFAMMLIIGR